MFLQLVQVSPPCSRVQLGHSGVSGVQSVGGDGVGGVIKMEVGTGLEQSEGCPGEGPGRRGLS